MIGADKIRSRARPARIALAIVFCWFALGGIAHFVFTDAEMRIVPPGVPWPRATVLLSGALELLGASGLLLPRCRRAAAWGLFALTVAVTPANLYMLQQAHAFPAVPYWALVLRLPLQLVLLALIWRVARAPADDVRNEQGEALKMDYTVTVHHGGFLLVVATGDAMLCDALGTVDLIAHILKFHSYRRVLVDFLAVNPQMSDLEQETAVRYAATALAGLDRVAFVVHPKFNTGSSQAIAQAAGAHWQTFSDLRHATDWISQ